MRALLCHFGTDRSLIVVPSFGASWLLQAGDNSMWQVRGLLTLGQGRVEAGLQRSAAAASRSKGGRADGLILRVCQAFRIFAETDSVPL
jgi:hypothetical protein